VALDLCDRYRYVRNELRLSGCRHLLRRHFKDPQGLDELARLAGWWSVYIFRGPGGSLCTGSSIEVPEQKLVWAKVIGLRVWAVRIQARIRHLTRKQKLALVEGTLDLNDRALIDRLDRKIQEEEDQQREAACEATLAKMAKQMGHRARTSV
jgi:hypothetical protein